MAAFCVGSVEKSSAQTYTVLENFEGSNGASPQYGALLQTTNGKLYGMTAFGGTIDCGPLTGYGCGSIHDITTSGSFSVVYDFDGTGGYAPNAGLVQAGLAQLNDLYGTTAGGGTGNCGMVFKLVSGTATFLHNFVGSDGCSPLSTLLNAADGELYGTTWNGGSGNGGTIFKITLAGELTTLHQFCQQDNCADGGNPNAALVQGADGNLYGTTVNGGALGSGTIFRITTTGVFTRLYSFCSRANCVDGVNPYAGLVQARDGNFYGVTSNAGANELYGTLFKLSPQGKLTTLHSFSGDDGFSPTGTLVYGSDGNLYGTSQFGGTSRIGNIYKATLQGAVTTLYSFCSQQNCTDGSIPLAGLVQDTDGNFYGETGAGGPSTTTCPAGYPCGVIYELSAGVHAFVKPWPMIGKVGTVVTILGNNMSSARSVKFNGVTAAFELRKFSGQSIRP
jgi:uncharacterized repeat protein (TIGR03803 family)